MQWFLRVVCIGYIVFLTLLLLSPDPSLLIGAHGRLPWLLKMMLPAAHGVSFCLLAVLALTPQWPLSRWSVAGILAIYGGMTELIQGLTATRTPEWGDWFQDLAGIAAGAVLCWSVAMVARAMMRPDSSSTQKVACEATREPTVGEDC